ncbi:UNVERIFIED_CONTAM: hypothetical protein HDU68_005561 [Siphonaria sp. JEL0065]|nr:hypothetical protein HDU68_005561 [Siphonaria sp. JEL0065]
MGKRCESRKCSNTVLHIRPDYGLHVCFECLKSSTVEVSYKRKRDQLAFPQDVLLHDRSAIGCRERNSHYILDRTYIDSFGEKCGPIVTVQSLVPIKSAAEALAFTDAKSKGIKKLTPDILTPFYLQEFEKYLTTTAKASAPDSPACTTILKFFQRVESSALAFEEVSKKRKADAKEGRLDAKKQKVEGMEKAIREMVCKEIPEWVADVALSSPFYFALTGEYRYVSVE